MFLRYSAATAVPHGIGLRFHLVGLWLGVRGHLELSRVRHASVPEKSNDLHGTGWMTATTKNASREEHIATHEPTRHFTTRGKRLLPHANRPGVSWLVTNRGKGGTIVRV